MRWWIWRLTRRRRWERRPTLPWSRTVLCPLTRPVTPCLEARGGAHPPRVARRRRMNTPPHATHAPTGTCTHLTTATRAAPTAPTGTSHRTGCCNTKLNKVTTRGTAVSVAAPGPETPTELKPPPAPPNMPTLHIQHSFLATLLPPLETDIQFQDYSAPRLFKSTHTQTHTFRGNPTGLLTAAVKQVQATSSL